ncbi:hypothetical protein EUTSA_v10017248mg [Eutrema salsugineum]|uniref:Uncharacterized protein n=1 Tax=Eutrema salsugineum TaxID=72664 RepID=V4MGQ7_EUTSA|nr:hypothetical protein EUTSA_v10017248mg [Eutrema salsugineum]
MKIIGKREIGCTVHFESSEKPNDETSNTVQFLEHDDDNNGGGIQEAWAEIKNHGSVSGGGFLAGEGGNKLEKRKSQVLLEGYVEAAAALDEDQEDLTRAKSLTDDDLEELKGCLDLGFGFSYDEIPELCNTLPALELCYSMSQKFLDDNNKLSHHKSPVEEPPTTTSPIANWKISSPGKFNV